MHRLICSVSFFFACVLVDGVKAELTCSDRDYIAHLDGVTHIPGGWLDHHWVQLAIQLLDSVTGFVYSFGGSIIILFCIDMVGKIWAPMKLRVSESDELVGVDDCELGEFAVGSIKATTAKTTLLTSSCSTITSSLRVKCSQLISLSVVTAMQMIPLISKRPSHTSPWTLISIIRRISHTARSIKIHPDTLLGQVEHKIRCLDRAATRLHQMVSKQ